MDFLRLLFGLISTPGLLLMLPIRVDAQRPVNCSASFLLEKMLDSAVLVVQSDYLLRDTAGDDYVRTEGYYTRSFSLGIQAGKILYLLPSAYQPWLTDVSQRKIDLQGGKKPVLTQVLAAPLVGGASVDITYSDFDSAAYALHDTFPEISPFLKEVQLSHTEWSGATTWLILYSGPANSNKYLRQVTEQLDWQPTGSPETLLVSKIAIPVDFLGGFVVHPVFTTGQLHLYLSGIVFTDPLHRPNTLLCRRLRKVIPLKKVLQKENTQSTSLPAPAKAPAQTKMNGKD